MITWRLILKKKRQAIDVKLKIEIIQKSSNKTTECNGEDFFGDDSKDEINILQRYCSAIDSSISAEEYIDIDNHALEDQIISDDQIIEFVKLTLQPEIEIQGEENLTNDHLPIERISDREALQS